MFKKILITLCALGLVVGAVIGIRALNTKRSPVTSFTAEKENEIPLSSLKAIEGEGWALADENEQMTLYVNLEDGNIRVLNKATGYTWCSRPTEEEMAGEKSNALWKNNLQSPVMFTYTTSPSSTDVKYTNLLSQDSRVTVYEMEKGVRVYLEFLESSVTFAYDLYLEGNYLKADIPSYLISDPGVVYKYSASGKASVDKKASCLIVDFYLFPSLGATRSDLGSQGYLLVPDGMGALMDFQSEKYAASQYIAHVYGADMALYNGFDTQLEAELSKPVVNYPVYGVMRDGQTMLAIIDRGETQADIIASKAGVQTGFNTVSARFVYRMKYKVITNSATGDGYLAYTGEGVREPRSLWYAFGEGTYVDMAQEYRGYLSERYGLRPMEDKAGKASLQLNLVGGDIESGMLGSSFIAMTSFEEAEEILRYFQAQGVESIDAVYSGWANRGESVRYPSRFPAASALGGDGGLKRLAQNAREMGVQLYLKDNHLAIDDRLRVSVTKSAVYNIQNNPLFDGAFANAEYTAQNYQDALARYRDLGISGLEEEMVGRVLITDYSQRAPTTRDQMKQAQRAVLESMRDDFGEVRLEHSRAWTLMPGVTFTALEGSSYLSILDESVPFYPIALHGLVDYLGGDYMEYYEPEQQLLTAIAQGASVSFTLSRAGTEKLALADSAAYFSTEFDLWKEDVLSIWQRLAPYVKATRGQVITGYESVRPGVTVTEYGNGVRVLVNQTGEETQAAGRTVPAQSFLLLEKGE